MGWSAPREHHLPPANDRGGHARLDVQCFFTDHLAVMLLGGRRAPATIQAGTASP